MVIGGVLASEFWFAHFFTADNTGSQFLSLNSPSEATAKAHSFNHVNLDDSTQTLPQYFGIPFRVVKGELPDTDEWSDPPCPFAFEAKAGLVTSIHMHDPARSK